MEVLVCDRLEKCRKQSFTADGLRNTASGDFVKADITATYHSISRVLGTFNSLAPKAFRIKTQSLFLTSKALITKFPISFSHLASFPTTHPHQTTLFSRPSNFLCLFITPCLFLCFSFHLECLSPHCPKTGELLFILQYPDQMSTLGILFPCHPCTCPRQG